MFLKLNHQKLEIFSASKKFVLQCYQVSQQLSLEGKYRLKKLEKAIIQTLKLLSGLISATN